MFLWVDTKLIDIYESCSIPSLRIHAAKFVLSFDSKIEHLPEWWCPAEFRNISGPWETFIRPTVWFLRERARDAVFASSRDSSPRNLSIYNERIVRDAGKSALVKTSIGLTRTGRPGVFRQTRPVAKKRLKFIKMSESRGHMSRCIDSRRFRRKSVFDLHPLSSNSLCLVWTVNCLFNFVTFPWQL